MGQNGSKHRKSKEHYDSRSHSVNRGISPDEMEWSPSENTSVIPSKKSLKNVLPSEEKVHHSKKVDFEVLYSSVDSNNDVDINNNPSCSNSKSKSRVKNVDSNINNGEPLWKKYFPFNNPLRFKPRTNSQLIQPMRQPSPYSDASDEERRKHNIKKCSTPASRTIPKSTVNHTTSTAQIPSSASKIGGMSVRTAATSKIGGMSARSAAPSKIGGISARSAAPSNMTKSRANNVKQKPTMAPTHLTSISTTSRIGGPSSSQATKLSSRTTGSTKTPTMAQKNTKSKSPTTTKSALPSKIPVSPSRGFSPSTNNSPEGTGRWNLSGILSNQSVPSIVSSKSKTTTANSKSEMTIARRPNTSQAPTKALAKVAPGATNHCRLRPCAPPTYLDYSCATKSYSTGSNSGNNGRGGYPVDRLQNVDVVEEFCYYMPQGDCCGCVSDQQSGYDYYEWCYDYQCGDMKLVPIAPCQDPCAPNGNPVKYVKRQHFNFQPKAPLQDPDAPPFKWPYEKPKRCCCKIKGKKNCCCWKVPFDEIPVGPRNNEVSEKMRSQALKATASDIPILISTEDYVECCSEEDQEVEMPPDSGVYYYDADMQKFTKQECPPNSIPKIYYEELEEDPPRPRAQVIQPVIQPIIIPTNGDNTAPNTAGGMNSGNTVNPPMMMYGGGFPFCMPNYCQGLNQGQTVDCIVQPGTATSDCTSTTTSTNTALSSAITASTMKR